MCFSASQVFINCVYNRTSRCLSVDMVPVMHEVQHHLESLNKECDITYPWQHNDPLMPIGNEHVYVYVLLQKLLILVHALEDISLVLWLNGWISSCEWFFVYLIS